MGVSLTKGGNVSLGKGLKSIFVGLGWDPRKTDGKDFDLDASAFLLAAGDKVRNDLDFVFYNNLSTPDGSVEHSGDDLTGGNSEGDDEVIKVDLSNIPSDIQKIAFTVTIHEADARKQNFGQVQNSFIRVVNQEDNAEIARYDLGEDASTETALIFGEIYRHAGEWKFKAVGQGFKGGLAPLARNYGVRV